MKSEDSSTTALSSDDLRSKFGDPVDLRDQLEEPDAPVEPMFTDAPMTVRLPPSLFVLLGVTVLLGVAQTVMLWRTPDPTPGAMVPPTSEPAETPDVAITPGSALEDEVRQTVMSAQQRLQEGMFEEVVQVLQPLIPDLGTLDPTVDLQVSLFLARAYLELGDLQRAQLFRDRATTHVASPDVATNLQDVRRLMDQRDFDEARRRLHSLACLADRSDAFKSSLPAIRGLLAESYVAQAAAASTHRSLPGLQTDPWLDGGEPWR